MTVAIYARVSSDSQEARGTIGSQLEVLRQKGRSWGITALTNIRTMATPERVWIALAERTPRRSRGRAHQAGVVSDARPVGSQLRTRS